MIRRGKSQHVTSVEWIGTPDQEVIYSALTHFTLALDQPHFRDHLGIVEPGEEEARVRVDGVALSIERFELKVGRWSHATWCENVRDGDLERRLKLIIGSCLERVLDGELFLFHIELTLGILIDQ